ncbi:MAG: polyprenyl synthetase family protein [Endozoicomonadaceae bacterium]|nr:polyprenyl synthetase family protein [Endozoicomonadaceae bacterium]
MKDFEHYLADCVSWVEEGLHSYLSPAVKNVDKTLAEAMRYSVFQGGKRIRPMLVHASCLAAGGDLQTVLPVACAIEMIHSYSLIHDDLPAMDDDDMRRCNPSCHKKFSEAVAILAGDALQTLAFEILATTPGLSVEQRLVQITTLAKAAGWQGMVSGQSIDIAATENIAATTQILEMMHIKKTGALILASLTMGAYAANASDDLVNLLQQYGRITGLAFQVQDDIMDAISDSHTLGKKPGSDKKNGKATYVSVMGLEQAKGYLADLLKQSAEILESVKKETQPLQGLIHFLSKRIN